jgi:hypothetical protein
MAICPIRLVMTDFETRLDGGGFGESLEYGPAQPINTAIGKIKNKSIKRYCSLTHYFHTRQGNT